MVAVVSHERVATDPGCRGRALAGEEGTGQGPNGRGTTTSELLN